MIMMALIHFMVLINLKLPIPFQGRRGLVVWLLDLQLQMQPVHITTKVRIPLMGEVLDTTVCVIFINDLWQVGAFLRVLRFPLPIKLIVTI